jgi:hypothetical protein
MLQQSMFQFFRSPIGRRVSAVVGLFLFYLIGVIARQHSGVRIVIRNESSEPVRLLSAGVENKGDWQNLQDLAPGDHERVFVKTAQQSRVAVEFGEPGHEPRTVTVFDQAETGGCGSSTVRILPQRNTESVETHESECWNSWLDFL